MDKVVEKIFEQGGLLELIVFLIPGFVAWRTSHLRRPQGEQKASDALINIFAFGVLTKIIWYRAQWTNWPDSVWTAIAFALQVFVTPVIVSLALQYALDAFAKHYWITSPHPRAWDFLFNSLAYRKSGAGSSGLFLVVTLKGGDKVAGVFAEPGFASLWPYDRDLLLGPTWELENGKPARLVSGSVGLYLDGTNIEAIEVFDYRSVVDSVASRGEQGDG